MKQRLPPRETALKKRGFHPRPAAPPKNAYRLPRSPRRLRQRRTP